MLSSSGQLRARMPAVGKAEEVGDGVAEVLEGSVDEEEEDCVGLGVELLDETAVELELDVTLDGVALESL